MHWISKEEERAAIKRMTSGKAAGPDDIPVEVMEMSRASRGLLYKIV